MKIAKLIFQEWLKKRSLKSRDINIILIIFIFLYVPLNSLWAQNVPSKGKKNSIRQELKDRKKIGPKNAANPYDSGVSCRRVATRLPVGAKLNRNLS